MSQQPAADIEPELEPVYVLVIDDQDGNSVWDQRFADDAYRRQVARAPTHLKRYYQVCSTATMARSAIDTVVSEQVELQLILIDNRLQVAVNSYRTQPEAVKLMSYISGAYRRNPELPTPPCVLATAEPDLLLSYAFIEAGGRQSLARNVATPLLLEDLWRVMERDERWRYVPQEPQLELTPAQRLVLPYMYADLAPPEIVRRMQQDGVLGHNKTTTWVHTRTSEIYARANDLLDRMKTAGQGTEQIPFFFGGEQRRVAQFALERGNIWLDPLYKRMLEEQR